MILTIIDKIPFNDESGVFFVFVFWERSRMFLEYNNWAAAFEPLLTRAKALRKSHLLKFATAMGITCLLSRAIRERRLILIRKGGGVSIRRRSTRTLINLQLH
jgi:hypothetical protein